MPPGLPVSLSASAMEDTGPGSGSIRAPLLRALTYFCVCKGHLVTSWEGQWTFKTSAPKLRAVFQNSTVGLGFAITWLELARGFWAGFPRWTWSIFPWASTATCVLTLVTGLSLCVAVLVSSQLSPVCGFV